MDIVLLCYAANIKAQLLKRCSKNRNTIHRKTVLTTRSTTASARDITATVTMTGTNTAKTTTTNH